MFSKLINHSGFRKYFFNTSWLFVEKILRILVGLFIGIWIARYLGPEQFGLFSFAQSFVGLFTVIATLGLDAVVVKMLLKEESQNDPILGTAFCLKLIGSFVTLIFIAVVVNLTFQEPSAKILIYIIASATIFQSFNVIDFYFQSKSINKYAVFSNVIALAVSSIIKVILLVNEASLIAFAWMIVFDSIIVALGLIYFFLYQKLHIKFWYFDFQLAKQMLSLSWPMIFSGLAVSFYMKIDQVMVKELLNEESVGYYAVAVKLSEVWFFITISIRTSLYPAIVNAKKISEALYYDRLQKMYQLLILIALLISVVVSIFSYEIIYYTFGPVYIVAADILLIYIWSNIFVFLNNGSWCWYIIENLQHLAAIRLFLGAVANFILNLYFIRYYGLEGAAFATVLSYALASYFGNLLSKKTRINFKIQTLAIINAFNFRSYFNKDSL